MHRTKAVQNRQEVVLVIFSPNLTERPWIKVSQKYRNMYGKFPKNLTLQFVTTPCRHHGAQ